MELHTNSTCYVAPLSLTDIKKTLDKLRTEPIVKEIRIKNKRFFIDILSDEPITPINTIFGIPILVDDTMPNHLIKLVYTNGKIKYVELTKSKKPASI
jgi:hypothetical protein